MVCEGTWIFCILLQTLCRKFCILEIQGGKEDKDAALKSLLVSSFVIAYQQKKTIITRLEMLQQLQNTLTKSYQNCFQRSSNQVDRGEEGRVTGWAMGRFSFSFFPSFWCQKYVSMEELIMMKSTLILLFYYSKNRMKPRVD